VTKGETHRHTGASKGSICRQKMSNSLLKARSSSSMVKRVVEASGWKVVQRPYRQLDDYDASALITSKYPEAHEAFEKELVDL
jgi:hypothetical protein